MKEAEGEFKMLSEKIEFENRPRIGFKPSKFSSDK